MGICNGDLMISDCKCHTNHPSKKTHNSFLPNNRVGFLFFVFLSTHRGMPKEALPQHQRKGKLSYTVTSPETGAKIEVLLKGRAFRITKVGSHNGHLMWVFSFQ